MKEAIMRWHSYQSLVARARRKRSGSTTRPATLAKATVGRPGAPNHSITITTKSTSKRKRRQQQMRKSCD